MIFCVQILFVRTQIDLRHMLSDCSVFALLSVEKDIRYLPFLRCVYIDYSVVYSGLDKICLYTYNPFNFIECTWM